MNNPYLSRHALPDRRFAPAEVREREVVAWEAGFFMGTLFGGTLTNDEACDTMETMDNTRVKVERLAKVECPWCGHCTMLIVTILGTPVYVCWSCCYHEEPGERGD